MIDSKSKNPIDDLSAFGALANSGADLRNYKDELQKDRDLRALSIRRLKRSDDTGLLSSLKCKTHTQVQNLVAAYSNIDISKYPFLQPECAIELLQSAQLKTVLDFCSNIQEFSLSNSILLQNLSSSPDFLQELVSTLIKVLNYRSADLISALSSVISIFLEKENSMILIDSELSMTLYDFFASEDPIIVNTGLALAESISSSSVYGRDSILCLGIHTSLIDLAKEEYYSEAACSALLSIFSKFHCPDIAIVCDCIQPMAELLHCPLPSSQLILEAFIEMTNYAPSIGVHICKCGLFPSIISLLDNPDLAPRAVRVIGNLGVGQPFQIQCLLESGLLDYLLPLLDNEDLTADVIWVLCNVVESYSTGFFDLFNSDDFLSHILEIANEGGIEERREASYFLATVIICGGESTVDLFQNSGKMPDLVAALVEMLGCGIEQNIKRYEDALLRLMLDENGKEIALALEDNDIRNRCEELEDQYSPQIVQSAAYIINLLDKFEEED